MFIISISVNGIKVFPFRLFPHRCSKPNDNGAFCNERNHSKNQKWPTKIVNKAKKCVKRNREREGGRKWDSKAIEKFIHRHCHCSFAHRKCARSSARIVLVVTKEKKKTVCIRTCSQFSMWHVICSRENRRQKNNNQLSAFQIFPFYFIVCACVRMPLLFDLMEICGEIFLTIFFIFNFGSCYCYRYEC